jgi:spore coat polysaccharide biosynthesis protein SpsF
MPVVAVIQARMGSSRLPGKVMMPIEGHPLIWHVHQRVAKAAACDGIVIATGGRNSNAELVSFLESQDILYFCGSDNDVLDRYLAAARKFGATIVVRITGDCPMIDPDVIEEVVSAFRNGSYDYVSNIHPPTYPDGLDVEVMQVNALERAHQEARLESEREHVTPYIWKHPERFKLVNHAALEDLSNRRWIVDDASDLEFVRAVFRELYPQNPAFRMNDVLKLLADRPDIAVINAGTARNEGYRASLRHDRIVSQ